MFMRSINKEWKPEKGTERRKTRKEKVAHYYAMSPTVVAASDCPKSFLSSSVPLYIEPIAN